MNRLQLRFMLLVVCFIKGKTVPLTENNRMATELKDELMNELAK